MLPVTRANLDYICSICLIDIRPSIYSKKVYDVSKEQDLCKLLKLTAHLAVLKNPMNQTYIEEYCKKICELCYVKSQYSFNFREKILASTIAVKEILESEDIDDEEIKRLQSFCRICLNRLNFTQGQTLTMKYLKWLKDCSGLRFTSLIETEIFRLKEGTNITELMVVNDALFPKQLCQRCIKNLRNMEDLRKQATQSFDYMISVMGDDEKSPTGSVRNFHVNIKSENENLLKAQEQNIFESEVYPENEIKVENEQLLAQELKFTSPDIELYHINESRDDSSDDNLTFETNFVDSDTIFTEKKQQCITGEIPQDHKSFLRDPIGKDENIESTIPRKQLNKELKKFNTFKDKTATIKYSEHEEVFKKECFSDLDFDDSDDSIKLIHLKNNTKPKRLKRIEIAKRKKKNVKNNDQDNNIKNELISLPIHNDIMEDQNDLLSDNQSNSQSNDMAKPQIIHYTKKGRHIRNTDKKLPDCNVDRSFDCAECSKSFRTSYVLKRHIKDMHSATEENMCPLCSKSFRRKHHLTGHIKTVHEKLKPFQCSYCDKAFSTRTIKRVHELSHSDTYPFVCDWCARRFRTSSQLKIHLEIHTTQPELLCPICKRNQHTPEKLKEHLKTHNEKRLQCTSCGKFFKSSTHLRDHQNAVHLKLRPFKCEFCDLAFGDRKTRRVHENSHKEDRPEKCTICSCGFKSRNTLGRHMKEFHFTEQYIKKNKKNKIAKSDTHQEAVINV